MSTPDQRPNIILIMTDQQRGDCLGIEGHPVLMTPRLDELATHGARFNHAYSTCPSCIAARRSILSGQHPATHGVVGFQNGIEWEPEATLPGELSKAGYQTVMVGRPMHQHPIRKRFGYDQMIFTGDVSTKSEQGNYDGGGHGLAGNGWTARPWHLDETEHHTYKTVTEALHFMNKWKDPSCPVFMTLSFLGPHPPLCPPAFYMDRYLRMDLPKPVIGDWAKPRTIEGSDQTDRGFCVDDDRVHLTGETLKSCQAAYYGLINHIDDQICRFLAGLGTSPTTGRSQLDNTVVIFTSDHGEMLGDHYLFRKTYPYEASARVPMLIQTPPSMGIKPGAVHDAPVCLEDLMPTILEMAGVPIPDSVDGKSMLPLLQGKTEWREYLHGEHGQCYGKHQSNHYVTDGQMKYVWYTNSGEEQLFNLDDDPTECTNLAVLDEHAQTLELWRNRLIEKLKDRPEGFTDGNVLIKGVHHGSIVPGTPGFPTT